MRRWMGAGLGLAASALGLAASAAVAGAADWRYCVAPDRAGHHVYLSSSFLSGLDLKALEDGFAAALREAGAGFDVVQCPRADSEARLDEMKRWSERYNLQGGLTAQTVEWSPGSAVAQLRGTR